MNLLNTLENVTVIGYMNWDHKKDTSPLLTKKSYDVWVNLIIGQMVGHMTINLIKFYLDIVSYKSARI